MGQFLLLTVVIVASIVAYSDACTSSSGRTPAWDVGSSGEIYPFYDNGAVGVGFTWRFRRDTDVKRQVFLLIDTDGNNEIAALEWIGEGGGVKNFVEFLNDDDSDGDEKISWEEFQKVTVANQEDDARQTNNQ